VLQTDMQAVKAEMGVVGQAVMQAVRDPPGHEGATGVGACGVGACGVGGVGAGGVVGLESAGGMTPLHRAAEPRVALQMACATCVTSALPSPFLYSSHIKPPL